MYLGNDATGELPAVDDHIIAEGCGYELDGGKLVRRWPWSEGTDASRELPAVDERLVVPGCGYEFFDGDLVRVLPAREPHARCRANLALLLETHAAGELAAALGMLTRTSETTDIAPDACVYPRARDPRTEGRQLEHLAFVIVDAATIAYAGRKAASLVGRGVRRVLAIDVERERVLEWSSEIGAWSVLAADASIADSALVVPLPVEALIREDLVDAAALRALRAKRNLAIEQAKQASKDEG